MEVDRKALTVAALSFDCADHNVLADFYASLLNGSVIWRTATAACVRVGSSHLIAQQVNDYQPPKWPGGSIIHLDLSSPDFDLAQQQVFAVTCGATLSPVQPDPRWAVLLDPAGHPFCLTPFAP